MRGLGLCCGVWGLVPGSWEEMGRFKEKQQSGPRARAAQLQGD